MQTIEGVYRNGKIELVEQPADIQNNTRVLITFLSPRLVELADHSIDSGQAADLRTRLQTFAADWEQPDMDVYDDYDAAKSAL